MKRFDIFQSGNGYRVACAVHLDGPVMERCPWVATLAEAQELRREKIIADAEQSFLAYLRNGLEIASQVHDGLAVLSDKVLGDGKIYDSLLAAHTAEELACHGIK
ncbi:MAG: hypothetical protein LBR94_00850 [Desulfovibrio sp.]|jgi:hypothetical protein|nr:hypothetical protein [Desulfovibrio sp.]